MSRKREKLKEALRKVLLIQDKPNKIAAGAAVGIFLGILPGGFTLALAAAVLFRLNKKAAVLTVLATNTWTTVLLLPVFAWVGGKMFDKNYLDVAGLYQNAASHGITYFFSNIIFLDIAVPLAAAMVLVSAAIALAVYIVIYLALIYYKRKFN